jgi:photosystem II stability/assembly factor-like uncharacterized protein
LLLILISFTSDGGANWKRQTTNCTTPLLSISFCDELNGWAVGDNGIILKTTNQGNDWIRVYNDTSINIRNFKVECISPTTTIVLRDSNTGDFHQETKIWKTTDDGESWEDISPYANGFSFLRDFSFTSPDSGWACGVGGSPNGYQIHSTTNGGISWNTKYFNSPTLWSMQKILFKNSSEGWATDWDTLYYTSDGGEIWDVSGVPNFNDLTDLVMFGSIGYASRLIGKIEKTTDSGNSWIEQSTAPANFVTDIEFINDNIGWAVGWNGMIYKTINGGVTSVKEDNQITKSFTLFQNYPNPFNPSTTITYLIPKESFVKLTVFNSIGQLVKILVNEYQPSGEYKINFNANGLTSGVYYYQLISDNKIKTKKFILLK